MKEQDTMELLNVTADCRKKKCDCVKNSPECKLRYFTANCDIKSLKDRQSEKPRLKHCVVGRTKDELIKFLSDHSKTKYGEKLVEFLETYKLVGLKDATVEQLQEYISAMCPQEREVK